MAEEGIAAVMTIVITKIMVPIVLMGIIITTLTITPPALITKETLVVMTIPQEVAIAITTITIIVIIVAIIAIIIRLALTMKVVATMAEEIVENIGEEHKEIIKLNIDTYKDEKNINYRFKFTRWGAFSTESYRWAALFYGRA